MKKNDYDDILSGIISIIRENSELRREIKRLETAKQSTIDEDVEEIVLPSLKKEIVVEGIEEDVIDEIGESAEFYFSSLKDIKLTGTNEDKELVRENIPVKSNDNYKKVLLRIIANCNKEINEYRSELERLKGTITEEEYNEYYSEIVKFTSIINYIKEIDLEKEEKQENKPTNRIVFMGKSSDRVYAVEDMYDIASDYYLDFAELFDSIIYGTFKNVRFFTANNDKVSGIAEVKGFKVRVLFDRVGPKTYSIIAAFVKKSDNDKDYRDFVKNRVATYRSKRGEIVKSLNDPEYLKSQDEYTKELYDLMGAIMPEPTDPKRGGR